MQHGLPTGDTRCLNGSWLIAGLEDTGAVAQLLPGTSARKERLCQIRDIRFWSSARSAGSTYGLTNNFCPK